MARKTAALEMDGGGTEGKVVGAGAAEPGAGGGAATSAEAAAVEAATSAEANAVGAAVSELGQAIDEAAGALAALGVESPTVSGSRRRDAERKPLTAKERAVIARRRTEVGKRLLAGAGQEGVAFVSRDVEIKHRVLSSVFVRTYPAADKAIGVLRRLGPAMLGADTMGVAFGKLKDLVKVLEDQVEDASRNVDTAMAQAKGEGAGYDLDIKLEYVAPIKQAVRATSPEARRILSAIINADAMLHNADRLHWAGARDYAEVDQVFMPIRRALIDIVVHAERTLRAVYSRQRSLAEPEQVADGSRAPESVAAA